MTFPDKLRNLLQVYGYSQVGFAEALGTSQSQVSAWLTRGVLPSAEYLLKISKLLNISINSLLDESYDLPTTETPRPAPGRQAGETGVDHPTDSIARQVAYRLLVSEQKALRTQISTLKEELEELDSRIERLQKYKLHRGVRLNALEAECREINEKIEKYENKYVGKWLESDTEPEMYFAFAEESDFMKQYRYYEKIFKERSGTLSPDSPAEQSPVEEKETIDEKGKVEEQPGKDVPPKPGAKRKK